MNSTLFRERDPEAERRRVLARVYRLLLRLAEEADVKDAIPTGIELSEEKAGEPVLVKENLSSQQIA